MDDLAPADRMTFLVYANIGEDDLVQQLGRPQYSYRFLARLTAEMLKGLGEVIHIARPQDADRIHQRLRGRCCLLYFAPPDHVELDLTCPTIPVFAWEFDSLPNESWGDDPRTDWRVALGHYGRAVCLSRFTQTVVRAAMGDDYPIAVIPSPVWDRIAPYLTAAPSPRIAETPLPFVETVIDSAQMTLDPVKAVKPLRRRLNSAADTVVSWYHGAIRNLLPECMDDVLAGGARGLVRAAQRVLSSSATLVQAASNAITLCGIVYTSVLNPADGRKNWRDILTAFCWAFRDTPDATLVLKMVSADVDAYRPQLTAMLHLLAPFRCRVVVLQGYLEEAEYRHLIGATTWYVNASIAEGLCLPLMEFMSAGRPAIAPRHTAMADYVDERVAFLLSTSLEIHVWPQDPRSLLRTHCHRLDWSSLVDAYRESYRVAVDVPEKYAEMAQAARTRMCDYASDATVGSQFAAFLLREQEPAMVIAS